MNKKQTNSKEREKKGMRLTFVYSRCCTVLEKRAHNVTMTETASGVKRHAVLCSEGVNVRRKAWTLNKQTRKIWKE